MRGFSLSFLSAVSTVWALAACHVQNGDDGRGQSSAPAENGRPSDFAPDSEANSVSNSSVMQMAAPPILTASPFLQYYDPVQTLARLAQPVRFSTPRFYAMTPVVVQGTDGVEYLFTCHNNRSGITRDHIFISYRDPSGRTVSYPIVGIDVQPAGMPTTSSAPWDGFQICDPTVVEGLFTMGVGAAAKSYKYALLYNGNDNANGYTGSFHNQLGVAFANNLRGPWVRYPYPLLWHKISDADWGVGQPAVTAVDSMNGKILLFYTRGDSTGAAMYRRTITLRDSAKGFDIGTETKILTSGLTSEGAYPGVLNNADIIYDGFRDRFIMARDFISKEAAASYPSFIGDIVEIADISAKDLWANSNAWRSLKIFRPKDTGFHRNHNVGFSRNTFGGLVNKDKLDVFISISCANNSPDYTKQCPDSSGSNHFSYKVFRSQITFSSKY